jgi:guanosine-3',5'-bis(diphosphate) 3'-pyrophosphohydrolase
MATSLSAEILRAVHFAATKHWEQRRKDDVTPYINHPIEVAETVARVGGVEDVVTLQAAVLHDTVEDTETTPEELERAFGAEVRGVVEELSDDKSVEKWERKRRVVAHAPHLSTRAKMIKIADMMSNVRSIADKPPADWSLERRIGYLDWSEQVFAGLRGCNEALEREYARVLERARGVVGGS